MPAGKSTGPARTPPPRPFRTTALNALSIAAFAPLGVAVRIALDDWFAACPDDPGASNFWDPCITSSGTDGYGGALFTSLPANMLACFIMGLIAPSTVIDPETDRAVPVALLPSSWAVQSYAPLWLGVRTGFLGALSTFASWNLQLVQMICNAHISPIGGQIPAALFGYAIGALLSSATLAVGVHVSEAIYRCHVQRSREKGVKRDSINEQGEAAKEEAANGTYTKPTAENGAPLGFPSSIDNQPEQTAGAGRMVLDEAHDAAADDNERHDGTRTDIPSLSPIASDGGASKAGMSSTLSPQAAVESQGRRPRPAPSLHDGESGNELRDEGVGTTGAGALLSMTADIGIGDDLHGVAELGEKDMEWGTGLGSSASASAPASSAHRIDGSSDPDAPGGRQRMVSAATDVSIVAAAAAVAAASAGVAAALPHLRPQAVACLLGPLGAGLRWVLGRLNGRWERHPWFPAGTLLANVLAATLDGLLKGALVHLDILSGGSFGGTAAGLAIQAHIDGFMGSLSTVSTLAMEAYNLLQDKSLMRLTAYAYFIATMGISLFLGVIAYGPFIWSLPEEYTIQ